MDKPALPLPGERLRAWQAQGTHRTLCGHRIHVHGSDPSPAGERPLLVLVHGFPTSSFDWHALWPLLSPRFRLLAPDLVGFGFSAKPKDHVYSIFEQADLIEALLADHAGEWHLLAHDYGDTVAQELLARHAGPASDVAGRLRSVCLLNGGLFPEAHRARFIQTLLASPLGSWLAPMMNRQRFGRSFASVFGKAQQPDEAELDAFWSLLAHDDGHLLAPRLLRYLHERKAHRERWVGALATSRLPIRFINGLDDPVSGSAMVARYRELMPAPDVVELPGVGHYPQVEAPRRVADAVLAFHATRTQAQSRISN